MKSMESPKLTVDISRRTHSATYMQVLSKEANNYYHGVVDMGSNGIRFSISDLTPPTARILPTLFQDRASISLYDAQHENGSIQRRPISKKVQMDVVAALLRFKQTCIDFGVPQSNIHIIATEATRTAPNSEEFRDTVTKATGWKIQMLSPEEEGRVGSLGIASSLGVVEGLVMDLGGGSVQITWVSRKAEAKRGFSFPYGAAALMQKLEEAKKIGNEALEKLAEEITSSFRQAYNNLDIPEDMKEDAKKNGGFDLYLSGGGFRGWGYMLMSQSEISPYPIQIINGFKVSFSSFKQTAPTEILAATEEVVKIFRVSDRRRAQAPAVAFLIHALTLALPKIKDVRFCQGGVREGFLFGKLPMETRLQDPLVTATLPYKTGSASQIGELIFRALPKPSTISALKEFTPPALFNSQFISAVANIMHTQSSATKETRSSAALHSTATGLLCYTHGLSHERRAALALVLYDSCAGDLPSQHESFLARLRLILSIEEAWWCRYIGRVTAFVGGIYPAGLIPPQGPRIDLEVRCVDTGLGKKGKLPGIELTIKIPQRGGGPGSGNGVTEGAFTDENFLAAGVRRIEKIGKRKHWLEREKGQERFGIKVGVKIVEGL
ncbi:retrograde regulation protein [Histoplasma capsulatum G186AR]|uniref:Retrograde regulation protein n=2 Tax=Ajellomyces capsulatus TaxID=5037 RepID=C0NSF1_AJECG|nr:retrograde regulation protein [Histoplasma capsulatum G186AR]EEH05817.1 retrograde regulation protein [Histoplasma capsulatum G186AR]